MHCVPFLLWPFQSRISVEFIQKLAEGNETEENPIYTGIERYIRAR